MSSAVLLHGQASGLLPSHPTSTAPSLLTFKGTNRFFATRVFYLFYPLPLPLHPLLKNTDENKGNDRKVTVSRDEQVSKFKSVLYVRQNLGVSWWVAPEPEAMTTSKLEEEMRRC